jgi:hypothetical protein
LRFRFKLMIELVIYIQKKNEHMFQMQNYLKVLLSLNIFILFFIFIVEFCRFYSILVKNSSVTNRESKFSV